MDSLNLIQNKLNLVTDNLNLISDNVANINTPNYKRKYIDVQNSNDFNSVLNLYMKKTDEKHMSGYESEDGDIKEVQSMIQTDGNGVDIDNEIVELNKNKLFDSSLIRLLNTDITNMKTVINSK